ncbi:hypothetical protein VCUG_02313 [Vavraia culicis subsp. floridensis]|uniref:Uncharacterized protein n=1 Tax=Vavraia culicis (isolate floridensis) TaxID=948595 RepID=L2GS42_VAVCU|nr:uncharacterized protein VCUG_02313 [Vavraia culicis subsp. floridensis]ELA46202.1 hypothetical protein VCUG_02313 [Vavraia culicis subsp. floridensis]
MERRHGLLGICSGPGRTMMYIVYNDEYAVAFDITDIKILMHALEINPPAMFMEMMDVFKCRKMFKRKLLAIFTTQYRQHCDIYRCHYDFLSKSIFFGRNLKEKRYCFEDFEILVLAIPCCTNDSFSFLIDDYLILGSVVSYLGYGKFYKGTTEKLNYTFKKFSTNVKPHVICCYGRDFSRAGYRFACEYFEVPTEFRSKKFLTFGEEQVYNPFFNYKKLMDEGNIESLNTLIHTRNRHKRM